jgi:hypothetical protein
MEVEMGTNSRNEEFMVADRKRKPGPKKWDPSAKQIRQVEGLAAQGLNREQIAAVLGVSLSSITRRRRDSAEFAAALTRGAHKGVAFVVNKLFEAVKHDNLKAIMFFLNARGGNWLQKPPSQAQVNAAEEERLEAERKKRAEDEQEELRRKEEAWRRLTIEEREMLLYLNRKARGEAEESEADVIAMRLLTRLGGAAVQK